MLSIDRVKSAFPDAFRPPPDLTVSQWADEYRRLSPEASSEPGRWDTNRAPYQRGILDALNDPDVHTIVVMSSAQVGKTEILLNIIGYFVHQDPSPMLCLQPTLDMAEAFSKDRLAPMVRDTPALRGKIADPRSRDSGNTLLHKKFPGGHVTLAGSNSPASLASRPVRVVLCDEVDRYPVSAAAEGDPVNLARKRATTFWNRKIVLTSTPTIKGLSRIETAYLGSDQRRYHVPCPHCGDSAPLSWERVKWDTDAPRLAAVVCQSCAAVWSEADRQMAIRLGKWVASQPFDGVAGFHLSEIYSPWSTPGAMAVAFLEAKQGGTEMLQTWVNTALGESWEEQGDGIDDLSLISRLEQYPESLPIRLVTAGVDVQKDRIEATVVGWGAGEEGWVQDHIIIPGDTATPDVWDDLDDELRGAGVDLALIDSGYNTSLVYAFTDKRSWSIAGKGMPGMGRPLIEDERKRRQRMRNRRRKGVRVEPIGVDQGKALVYSRLKMPAAGPGCIHFPQDPAFDDEYFSQLAAEKLVTKYRNGRPFQEWVQTRPRNEALDCLVYATAAMRLARDQLDRPPAPPQKQNNPPPKSGSQWIKPTKSWINRR